MRTRLAALLLAVMAGAAPPGPARAQSAAPPDSTHPFEIVGTSAAPKKSNKWAWITAITGATLVGVSFPLADEADRRYLAYLAETDVRRLDERFIATQRMDRLASGVLLAGEGLLGTAVWLRFVRGEHHPRVAVWLRPDRCAIAVSY